ncbi:MAG: acetoacetate--CoA ligase [Desulfopila sp.]
MREPLWKPSQQRRQESNMYRFMMEVNATQGTAFSQYDELYDWSVTHLADFWTLLWRFVDIRASQSYDQVIDDPDKMPGATWFTGARLNFAENLLRHRDARTALIFRGEDTIRRTLSYAELFRQTARVAAGLRDMGVGRGDRVVGFMPNMPETVIAMLAAASIGAIWSSCSPDFGIKGILDRFGQTEPKVIFCADGYYFKGKPFDCLAKISAIQSQLPSLQSVVVVPYLSDTPQLDAIEDGVLYSNFCDNTTETIDFVQLPFSHPLYIMYSSGTTGLPKCMVQSGGGVLLNQLKELILHTDLKSQDTIFYFTTCGWMMWNWLVASLATGATLVLYDGNPFYPGPEALWRMAQEEKISIFGTSAGYIAALKNSTVRPGATFDLSSLKTLLSTGSPLPAEDFHFIYREIKSDLQLSSISGGSDLNGCFALGNPMGPVYAGELQCRGLGMKVLAYDESGKSVVGRQGDLVCTAPFPSMPISFWDDADGSKYHAAYFTRFPGIWTHGDFIEITEQGGVIIYGRSDATLNPGGVRIGTSEIYRIVEQITDIEDCLVIGQRWQNNVRVVLFVKLKTGGQLSEELRQQIRYRIRTAVSPRHVPAKIIAVPDIPYTLTMKKVELAVKNTLHGLPVTNKDALRNPESLDFFKNIEELNT